MLGTGPIDASTLGVLAQVLPALLAIGLLVPIFTGMKLQTPERVLFGGEVIYVLGVEGIILWQVINGGSAPGGFRPVFVIAALYALLGIAIVALAWTRSTPEEMAAERRAYQNARAARRAGKARALVAKRAAHRPAPAADPDAAPASASQSDRSPAP